MGQAESSPEAIEALADAVSKRAAPSERSACADFVRLFFHHYRPEDMALDSFDSRVSCLSYLWGMVVSGSEHAVVEVFNPGAEQHGWSSPYTVVAIRQTDMPFLVDSVRIELASRSIPI